MTQDQTTRLASAIVLFSGAFWGIYWLPVRALDEAGLDGAWGTLAIALAAVFLLAPLAALRRRRLLRANRVALLSVALGGAAFALYSIGFVYGRVAIIILLYFLTPVWSTLLARYVMGWHTPGLLSKNSTERRLSGQISRIRAISTPLSCSTRPSRSSRAV